MALVTYTKPRSRSRFTLNGWVVFSVIVAALALLPVLTIALTAVGNTGTLWSHVVANVLPQATRNTLTLLIGTGILVTIIGTGTAWLVTAYSFPGRGILEWALLLPLAVPTYIMAYAYMDVLSPLGWIQDTIRAILGYSSPRDFRLPDIRTMWGAIVLFGFVLYPYVYLTTRAMFLTQASNLVEVARTLGVGRSAVFWRVALPLARPAIAVGVSLALMEALNDVGASQFLGVRTLTASVYTTWIVRTDLTGAAQIATAMLVFVVTLILLERMARRQQRYAHSAQRARTMTPTRLRGWRGWLALSIGSIPIVIGFLGPALYLVLAAIERVQFAGVSPYIVRATINTVTMSATATLVVLVAGFGVAYAARLRPGAATDALARISALGYAVPGTVLGIGILIPVAAFDRFVDQSMRELFGYSTGLLMIGSGAALVYAYAARFLAIASGGIEAGLSRIPLSYDHAARTLGHTATGSLARVHLPLSRTALTAAGLLVFVDCMKELPATLLLRPLNFESLSSLLYGEAARGTYEEAALAAVIIVAIGILPVIFLARTGRMSQSSSAAESRL
ncbi:ABC transporter permease [Pelagibacterium montanilacus]|uniref:ABC transporter permease n=1 Tax=Pelagibacterium montanilacus TaxID=2185280 RepID=UPI000F8E5328|nr:iron ABC transporter permease [Pelagibacterium montanilacus]